MAANADISLKVMVHKQENRVIFVEADSNFVDTLFCFMTMPMSTIVRLLKKCPNEEDPKALGSLTNLYQSLMDLFLYHFSTEESKSMMLKPRSSSFDHCRKLKLTIDDDEPITNYFICLNLSCGRRVGPLFSTCNFARCSFCGMLMDRESKYDDSTAVNSQVGCLDRTVFVCDGLTFIITNDLRVMPKTSDSNVLLLRGLGITDSCQLEERTLEITHQQILIFLNLALLFKNPLTELVFPGTHHIRRIVDHGPGTLAQDLISCEIGRNFRNMRLKVALQKSTSKFLFAEADEDFVEFVFGFLEIPLGIVTGKSPMNGFENLFSSISNMRVGKYIKSQDLKDILLNPRLEQKVLSRYQIFPLNVAKSSQDQQDHSDPMTSSKKSPMRNFKKSLRRFKSKKSSGCIPQTTMVPESREITNSRAQESFLKAPFKFMLTDDLVVTPLSFVSALVLLNKLNVFVDDVEEHEIRIGIEEGLKILKASLKSSSTLSDALLDQWK